MKRILDAFAPIATLPRPVKITLGIVTALGLGALAARGFGKGGWMFVLILVVLLLVLLGGYFSGAPGSKRNAMPSWAANFSSTPPDRGFP